MRTPPSRTADGHGAAPTGGAATPPWHTISFLLGLAAGGPLVAYGVWWLVHNAGLTHPVGWTLTLAGAIVAHDLVLVPVVAGVGALLTRISPAWLRVPLRSALALSLVCALLAYPALSDRGRRPSNPTLLPRDLAVGLALVLVAIWVAALLWALARRQRSRASAHAPTAPRRPIPRPGG